MRNDGSIGPLMVSPAAQWVGEIAEADGIDPRTIRSVGDALNLAQVIQGGKVACRLAIHSNAVVLKKK